MSKRKKPPEDRGRPGDVDSGDEELALEGLEEEGPEMEPLTSADDDGRPGPSGNSDSVGDAGRSPAPPVPRQSDLLEGSEGVGEPLPEFRLVPHTFEWADPDGWDDDPEVEAPDESILELQGLEDENSVPLEPPAMEPEETVSDEPTPEDPRPKEPTTDVLGDGPPDVLGDEPPVPPRFPQGEPQGDVFGSPADEPSGPDEDSPAVGSDPSLVRLAIARHLWAEGEHQAALDNLDAAVAEAPERLEVLVELGATLGALGRYDDADVYLQRAQRLAPGDDSVAAQLGIILFRRGLYAAAELELRGVTERDGTLAEAHFYRGEALNRLGRSDEALDVLLRAVELDPDNPRAYQVMGMLYDRKRMPELATAMYRKARELGRR
jgi:Flp pilus assembly protein TadD